jgi:hypothetical protein
MTDDQFAAEFGHLNPLLRCQNPWFLPKDHIDDMWTIVDPKSDASSDVPAEAT